MCICVVTFFRVGIFTYIIILRKRSIHEIANIPYASCKLPSLYHVIQPCSTTSSYATDISPSSCSCCTGTAPSKPSASDVTSLALPLNQAVVVPWLAKRWRALRQQAEATGQGSPGWWLPWFLASHPSFASRVYHPEDPFTSTMGTIGM